MNWISHDDRTLEEHLSGLKEVADYILAEKSQNLLTSMQLRELVYCLISYHDLAKASIYFQLFLANALIKKGTGHKYYSVNELQELVSSHKGEFKEWITSPELKEHSLLGAWSALATLGKSYGMESFLFLKVLKRHHGYLRNFTLANLNPADKAIQLTKIASSINFTAYKSMVASIGLPFEIPEITALLNGFKVRDFKRFEMSLQNNKDSSYYFKTLFLYSILLSADKGDVMLNKKKLDRQEIKSSFVDSFKKKTIASSLSINELREESYQIAIHRVQKFGKHNFFSITLPTGLGKTFTSYKVALQLREQECPNFRIIYCLPFTSIIDQNAKIFKQILESSDVKKGAIGIHHHLSVPEYAEQDDSLYPEWEYFTEGWQNEITITTFIQIWESIFANHNKQIRKLHNLVNSVIILDEIQSINPALLPALEFVMEAMAKYFNTKFILVTATQPILLRNKVVELCLNGEPNYYFKRLSRTAINMKYLDLGIVNENTLSNLIIDTARQTKYSILVICNTIRYSQGVFQSVRKILGEDNVFYLSAAIIPNSREKILEEIKLRLASKQRTILISTQVVEAGVDIDFDTVYRDFAPLASLNQAAGRCNRNSTMKTSKIYIFRSGKEKIYDPTQMHVTEKTLQEFGQEIPEKDYFELNQIFFSKIKSSIQDNSGVSESLIKSLLSLKFEDIGRNRDYRLITEEYKSNNFFISIDEQAKSLWNEYTDILSTDEHFKRKMKIRLLMPTLMQYVVKIPEYIHKPSPMDQNKVIIYDSDWERFYDIKLGYRPPVSEKAIEVI